MRAAWVIFVTSAILLIWPENTQGRVFPSQEQKESVMFGGPYRKRRDEPEADRFKRGATWSRVAEAGPLGREKRTSDLNMDLGEKLLNRGTRGLNWAHIALDRIPSDHQKRSVGRSFQYDNDGK